MSILYFILEYLQLEMIYLICKFDFRVINYFGYVFFFVKVIFFFKIFNIIVVERVKYVVIEIYRFFIVNEDFVRIFYFGKLLNYVWNDEVQYFGYIFYYFDTSDYYIVSGSMILISGVIFKVGSVRVFDFIFYEFFLNEFVRYENEFVENFLFIVCNLINFFRKGESSFKSKYKFGKFLRSFFLKFFKGQDIFVLFRVDSKRKIVFWGDSADILIRLQLINRYMDVLWRFFGLVLEQCFYESLWGCRSNQMVGELGSVVFSGVIVVIVVRNMMEYVCFKGIY